MRFQASVDEKLAGCESAKGYANDACDDDQSANGKTTSAGLGAVSVVRGQIVASGARHPRYYFPSAARLEFFIDHITPLDYIVLFSADHQQVPLHEIAIGRDVTPAVNDKRLNARPEHAEAVGIMQREDAPTRESVHRDAHEIGVHAAVRGAGAYYADDQVHVVIASAAFPGEAQ